MNAVSLLDDKTVAAIRAAMRAAGSGQLADACRIGEEALEAGGDRAALNAMLGTLNCRNGNMEAGVRHLMTAHEERPSDVVITNNLATALAQLGRNREALDIVTDDVARSDPSLQLLRVRAFLAQVLEEYDTATEAYERVVAAAPDDWESWNNLGNARRGLEDFEGALEALKRASDLNPRAAPTRFNYATALEYA